MERPGSQESNSPYIKSMIDILIPLGKGSRHDNFELRMCLRSIEKHLKGVSNIFIVGEKPGWVQNVVHIPQRDNPNNWMRAHNIYSKIMAACSYFDDLKFHYQSLEDFERNEITASLICISDNFLFMNDDHYLLTDYEASEFPYYHRGVIDLEPMIVNRPQLMQMQNTIREISGWFSYSGYDFDIHCPIVYNKNSFRHIFNRVRTWPEHGYGIKSFYCSHLYLGNVKMIEDLKFSEPAMKESIYRVLEDRPWFSIGDNCLKSGAMKEVLTELYPNKSKWEI